MASLKATECHHWPNILSVSSLRMVGSVVKNDDKSTILASRFSGHGDAPVQYQAHHPMDEVQGYAGSHWSMHLGTCIPRFFLSFFYIVDRLKRGLG
jgi:hypothetical protein